MLLAARSDVAQNAVGANDVFENHGFAPVRDHGTVTINVGRAARHVALPPPDKMFLLLSRIVFYEIPVRGDRPFSLCIF